MTLHRGELRRTWVVLGMVAALMIAGCGEQESSNPTPQSTCANFRYTPSASAPRQLAWNITTSPTSPRAGEPFFFCLGLGNRRVETTGPFTVVIGLERLANSKTVFERKIRLSGVEPGDGRTIGERLEGYDGGRYAFRVEIGPTRLNEYEQFQTRELIIAP